MTRRRQRKRARGPAGSQACAPLDDGLSRATYLLMQAVAAGADVLLAREAVASVAIEHPEWDLEERRTWAEWEQLHDAADRTLAHYGCPLHWDNIRPGQQRCWCGMEMIARPDAWGR